MFDDEAAGELHRTSSAVKAFTVRPYPRLQEDVEFKTFRRVASSSVMGPV